MVPHVLPRNDGMDVNKRKNKGTQGIFCRMAPSDTTMYMTTRVNDKEISVISDEHSFICCGESQMF